MPKSTFYNLSDDKKKRIFDAAVQEFSTRRFSEASLNQIIKNAGIPKGSFYQYFNDKEDIYLYMLEEMSKEEPELDPNAGVPDPEADFFEIVIQRTKASFKLGRQSEYTRIGILMLADNSEFITKLLDITYEWLKRKLERDKERGLIKPETDADLVVKMLFAFTMEEYFRNGLDENLLLRKLNDAVKIIKEGISMSKN